MTFRATLVFTVFVRRPEVTSKCRHPSMCDDYGTVSMSGHLLGGPVTREVSRLPPATAATAEVAFQPLCLRRRAAREGYLTSHDDWWTCLFARSRSAVAAADLANTPRRTGVAARSHRPGRVADGGRQLAPSQRLTAMVEGRKTRARAST